MIISIINLISLIQGGIGIVLIYSLTRRNDIPFLHYYLFFLICAVITGFCDWIIFNWVLMLVPGISPETADSIYHIFWDLVGFPAYLFAFYYLIRSVNCLLKMRIRNLQNKIFITILITIIVLDYIGLYFRLQDESYIFSKPLWLVYTLILPFAILSYLALAYYRSVRDSKKRHAASGKLILILFLGFLLWSILSLAPLFNGAGRHLIILAFYLAIFIPAVYVYIRQKDFMVRPEIKDGIKLEEIFKYYKLTARETELALLLMEGKSNQEISEILFVSTQTVKNYISKMYKQVGVKNRIQFVNLFRSRPS